MADSNYPNAEDRNDLTQDDPFAELTRIMGHNPRPELRPVAEEQPADDLALELENELMGGLGENEPDAPREGETFALDTAVQQEAQSVESGISEIEPVEPDFPQDIAFAEAHDVAPAEIQAEPAREAQAVRSEFDGSEPDTTLEASLDQVFSADDEASVAAQPEFPQDGFGVSDERAPRQEGFGESGGEVEPFVIREEDFAALDSDFTSPESVGDQNPASSAEPAAPDAALSFATFQEAETLHPQDVAAEADPEPLPASIFTAADAATATYRLAPELALPTGREDTARVEDSAPVPESTDDSAGGALGDWSLEHIFGGNDKPHVEELSTHADDAREALPDAGAAELPPEIDTVDVPEEAVAVADTLDVPDVPHREETKPAAELDEIDELLAGAFGEAGDLPEVSEADWRETGPANDAAPAPASEDERLDEFLAAGIAAGLGVAGTAAHVSRPAEAPYPEDLNGDFSGAYSRDWEHLPEQPVGAGLAPAPGIEPPVENERGRPGSRALLAAAVAGGVVILGGVTVFALTFNGGESSGPALVKADNEPVKVQPEDPGGTIIPNQDNQVYKRVSGEEAGDAVPAQAELVSTAEEPVDLPGVTGGASVAIPSVMEGGSDKREDRLDNPLEEASAGETEVAALAPRRVRSLVVRPDGTMVPREMPEPQENASTSAGEQSAAADGNAPDSAETAAVDTAGATETTDVPIPSSAPIPPSRPANIASTQQQPSGQTSQTAQSNPAPTQVAAAEPQPAQPSVAASGWSVQIASQPSAQDAQQSYQELAQRYGNLLQGRGVNIVKADIAGKGTYYRVRIPSSSKDEAVRLCSQLKSAGGNCFVSQ